MEYRILSGIRQGFPSVRAQAGHRSHLPANRARLPGVSTSMANSSRAKSPLILGSSVAFIASALLNNRLNEAIGKLLRNGTGFGVFALRSYASTFLGQFADNLIFALLVSRTFFGWTLVQCLTCALTGAVAELLFEVLFSPLGYRLSRRILAERKEALA